MIDKRSLGNDAGDLVRYLAGPGRHNEHSNQRFVAAGDGISAPRGELLTTEAVSTLAFEMDLPRRLFDVTVRPERVMTPERPTWPEAHVWHTSLAAAQPDATLCDEQWSKIAAGLMDELGFSETPGRAPCPWVAIHHGPNSRGCDHVHIAVSLIREDGTVASIWQDKRKASAYMARVEREQNLYVVPGRPAQARPSANTERSWSRPSGGAGRRPTS